MTVECKINGASQAYFTKPTLPKQAFHAAFTEYFQSDLEASLHWETCVNFKPEINPVFFSFSRYFLNGSRKEGIFLKNNKWFFHREEPSDTEVVCEQ